VVFEVWTGANSHNVFSKSTENLLDAASPADGTSEFLHTGNFSERESGAALEG